MCSTCALRVRKITRTSTKTMFQNQSHQTNKEANG